MENREALMANKFNRLTTVIALSAVAMVGGQAIKAENANAEAINSDPITCPSTGYQPWDDPCVGRSDGTEIIRTTYTDYPATDPAESRTLYVNPNGSKEAIYNLGYGVRSVVYSANDTMDQCYVYPNTGQMEDCLTYDTANNTGNVPVTDEFTIDDDTTGGGGETGGGDDDGNNGSNNGGETGGNNGGQTGSGTTGGETSGTGGNGSENPKPTVSSPSPAHVLACTNAAANILASSKNIKRAKVILPRTALAQARFKTMRQLKPECNDVNTQRNITVQFYQIGRNGKAHAVTKRVNILNSKNDNNTLRGRKIRTIGKLLCGPRNKYWAVYRANAYATYTQENGQAKRVNSKTRTTSTRKYAKSCK